MQPYSRYCIVSHRFLILEPIHGILPRNMRCCATLHAWQQYCTWPLHHEPWLLAGRRHSALRRSTKKQTSLHSCELQVHTDFINKPPRMKTRKSHLPALMPGSLCLHMSYIKEVSPDQERVCSLRGMWQPSGLELCLLMLAAGDPRDFQLGAWQRTCGAKCSSIPRH